MALEVKNPCREGKFRDISFDVHKGEVFGFFGLKGPGRSELDGHLRRGQD